MRCASAVGCLALACAAWPAVAQDAARGRELYEAYCTSCHYERIHRRDPARSLVKTFAQLRSQVAERAVLTGRAFPLQDLDDIAEYLNRSHYRLVK